MTNYTTTHLTAEPIPTGTDLTSCPTPTVTTDEQRSLVLGTAGPEVAAGAGRACEVCGAWTANKIAGRRIHTACQTDQPDSVVLGAELVAQGCAAATRRLRWVYTSAYRRRLRLPGVTPNLRAADEIACQELRHHIPVVLARHLPGITLIEWMDPNPAVIDSSWALPGGWDIDVYWNYHPDWTIGDATAITVWHEHAVDNDDQAVTS